MPERPWAILLCHASDLPPGPRSALRWSRYLTTRSIRQAIITRADYIARHEDCPGGSPALSQTESVSPRGPQGAWLVHYQIGGQQLTDYWFYVQRRWVFDLVLSNPDQVRLYRMSQSQYVAALGCAH